MKHFLKHSAYAAAFLCIASTAPAWAQETVPVTASVQNTVTVTATQGMNFGTIVAIPDGGDVTAVMATDGTLTVSGASTATGATVDDSAAQPAIVTVTDASEGATLQVTIDGVVDPVNGSESFGMATFQYRRNGELSEQSASVSTPFDLTYADNSGAGSTITIGATLTGTNGDSFTATTPYVGSFDVTVTY